MRRQVPRGFPRCNYASGLVPQSGGLPLGSHYMENTPETTILHPPNPRMEGKHPDRVLIPEGIRPLPEIVLPENIRREREEGINRLLDHPPNVDCILVLRRSGTLAASGIYEDPERVKERGLKPIYAIEGIGNEVYAAFCQEMPEELEDTLDWGIGREGKPEAKELFNKWALETDNPRVRATIKELQKIPVGQSKIAILDDITQSGSVALGVAPAMFAAAGAEGANYSYEPVNNRMIFKSADWIAQIVRATFQESIPDLDERQVAFLVEIAKGSFDMPQFTKIMDRTDIGSLDEVAKHYATVFLSDTSHIVSEDKVPALVKQFGSNLFSLRENMEQALRSHSEEILQKRVVSGDVQSVAAH